MDGLSTFAAPGNLPDRASARRQRGNPVRLREAALYALVAVLVGAAWVVSQFGWFTAGSDPGYWIGVAGGLTMVALFAYPMRKYLGFMRHWGRGAVWFTVHMVLGIVGPLLILLHSTFRIGSVNAGVALIAMLVVAGSGIIGRFIFVHIHRGLHGENVTLQSLQEALGLHEAAVHSRLRFAPRVEAWLKAFEGDAFGTGRHPLRGAAERLLVLPLRRWHLTRRCRAELRVRLLAAALERGWSPRETRSRLRKARRVVDDYLLTLQRVAQYRVYVRLFSLWHVAHVPFVYLMVITAVVHVIAVHAY
jgi:hypothetical protein